MRRGDSLKSASSFYLQINYKNFFHFPAFSLSRFLFQKSVCYNSNQAEEFYCKVRYRMTQ